MTPNQFDKKIRKLFRVQSVAAEAMGLTPGAISHFCTGRRPIPRYVEILLACLEAKTPPTT